MRKILLIIIIIACVGGGGYYLYSTFFSNPDASDEEVGSSSGLHQITSTAVVSPINSYNNSAIWYGLSTGKLMRYSTVDGAITEHPMPTIPSNLFTKLYWPKIGNDFIALSSQPTGKTFYYYNASTQEYVPLPSNVINLGWLASGLRIVLTWASGDGKTYLVVSNPDASGYRIVRELPWSDLVPYGSPKDNMALLIRQNSNAPTNKIYLFDLQTGEYIEKVVTGRSTGVVWSPSGNGFSYTQMEEGKNKVFYYDLATDRFQSLGLTADINKIAFNSDGSKLYIVSPKSDGTGEDVWEYVFSSDLAQIIYTLDENVNARDIIVDGEQLYFKNTDDHLYTYQR